MNLAGGVIYEVAIAAVVAVPGAVTSFEPGKIGAGSNRD